MRVKRAMQLSARGEAQRLHRTRCAASLSRSMSRREREWYRPVDGSADSAADPPSAGATVTCTYWCSSARLGAALSAGSRAVARSLRRSQSRASSLAPRRIRLGLAVVGERRSRRRPRWMSRYGARETAAAKSGARAAILFFSGAKASAWRLNLRNFPPVLRRSPTRPVYRVIARTRLPSCSSLCFSSRSLLCLFLSRHLSFSLSLLPFRHIPNRTRAARARLLPPRLSLWLSALFVFTRLCVCVCVCIAFVCLCVCGDVSPSQT